MSFYSRLAFKLFGNYISFFLDIFPELKKDLKKAGLKFSSQEYIAIAILTSFLLFIVEMPIFSIIYGILSKGFLFSFLFSFTTSLIIAIFFFYLFVQYPKFISRERARKIDESLPFGILHLATILKSKIPLHRALEILSKIKIYKEFTKDVQGIIRDIKFFGIDIATALERAAERTPSKKLSEIWWGILSNFRAGSDISVYLRQKGSDLMNEYRKKIYEFSHTLSVYIEIYLTAIIIGSIFFVILTAIFSAIGTSVQQDIITLQFILIFIFIPTVSIAFIYFVKRSQPGAGI
ncbi:MAG: hypothetical protein B6U78_02135 [Candidatus Aenigmarchaeota archaeon ex4484_224]|nr:MAG: hypothetical protein B6U78_02135 [Candidatus Aenigmarchaeota archaeon ex4484_224]